MAARLLFPGLWMIADRDGRMEYRPRRIQIEVFPYDQVDIDSLCGELENAGMIVRYEVGGVLYLWIPGFARHQNLSMQERHTTSSLPPPPERIAKSVPIQDEFITNNKSVMNQDTSGNDSISLNMEVLNTDILSKNISRVPNDDAHVTPSRTTKPSRNSKPPPDIRRFDEFWALYPHKKAKQDAIKAWGKIKPDETLFSRIMDAVREQLQSEDWRKENGRFIPYPATWLNSGRWEDVVTPPKGAQEWRSQREREADEFFAREQLRIENEFGGDCNDVDGNFDIPY
jgi:hypothetical protein